MIANLIVTSHSPQMAQHATQRSTYFLANGRPPALEINATLVTPVTPYLADCQHSSTIWIQALHILSHTRRTPTAF